VKFIQRERKRVAKAASAAVET